MEPQNKNESPFIIEIYTGLTFNYFFNTEEYRNSFYPILKKLLLLSKRGLLPISAKKLQEYIVNRDIPIEIINEILNEMHYYSVLMKVHYPDKDNGYDLAIK